MNIDKTLSKIFTLTQPHPYPPLSLRLPPPSLLSPAPSCEKLRVHCCLCRNHITLDLLLSGKKTISDKLFFGMMISRPLYLALSADLMHRKYRGISDYQNHVTEVCKFRNKTVFRQ